jgi:putative chitinase
MADTSPTPEKEQNAQGESLTYLNIIAKSFLSIKGLARDTNVARQNIVKLVKLRGGTPTLGADAHFLKSGEAETKLGVQKEKYGKKPEPVAPKPVEKKSSFLETIINFGKSLFNPKNLLKALGKIALPILIITTLWEGFSSAFDAYKETGSIWEAFKAGIGGIVDFLTFGIFDKQMVDELMENVADFLKPVTDAVGEFFTKFSDFFTEKFNGIKEFLGIPVEKKTQEVAVEGSKEFDKMNAEEQQQAVNALNAQIRAEENRIRKKIDALAAAEEDAKKNGPSFGEKAREVIGVKKTTAAEKEAETGVKRTETAPAAAPAPTPAGKEPSPSDSKPKKVGSESGKKAMIKAMDDAKVTSPSARAAIMAQVAHESGDFTTLSENLNYKAPTLLKLFPKKFTSPEDAAQVAAGGPKSVAERIYGGRMGNSPEGGGDGYMFRGRGFVQLTGKQNYTKFGVASNPDSVAEPQAAADTAMKYMLQYKGSWDDVKAVTKFVNGGYIGLDDRMKHFQAYLNDPTITQVGAAQSAPSGGTAASASTQVAADQRQQQKSSTPIVVNAPTTNTNVQNSTQVAAAKQDSSTANKMAARAG